MWKENSTTCPHSTSPPPEATSTILRRGHSLSSTTADRCRVFIQEGSDRIRQISTLCQDGTQDARWVDWQPLYLLGAKSTTTFRSFSVALNYQTEDPHTFLNRAKFKLDNGGCGYVLKPEVRPTHYFRLFKKKANLILSYECLFFLLTRYRAIYNANPPGLT